MHLNFKTSFVVATVAVGAAACGSAGGVSEPTADSAIPEPDASNGRADSGRADSCGAWLLPPDSPAFGQHTATLLNDGRVLVVGDVRECPSVYCAMVNGVLFDLGPDTWTLLPAAPPPLAGRTATLLADGRVLFIGGVDYEGNVVSTVTVFDPASDDFSTALPIATALAYHTALLLPDGRVLVAGGRSAEAGLASNLLSSVQIYDPVTQGWTDASPMLGPRERHTATLIDGWVAVVGGVGVEDGLPRAVSTTEVYYPPTDEWQVLGDLGGLAVGHTTTGLGGGGELLVVSNGVGAVTKTWFSHWYPAGSMRWPRSNHVAVRMRDGRILVAGGTPYQTLLTPEIHDPETQTWTIACDQPTEIWAGSATLLNDDRILVISIQALIFQPPA